MAGVPCADFRDGYIKIVYRTVSLKQALDIKGNMVPAVFLGLCVLVTVSGRKKDEEVY